jgi:hypothetical protein
VGKFYCFNMFFHSAKTIQVDLSRVCLVVYSTSTEWSMKLAEIADIQLDLMKLTTVLPNANKVLFEFFAAFFEDALNDRWDSSDLVSRKPKVLAAFSFLKTICEETSRGICYSIEKNFKQNASSSDEVSSPQQEQLASSISKDPSFYLNHLVGQQHLDAQKASALEDLVLGDGFMACYTTLLEEFCTNDDVNFCILKSFNIYIYIPYISLSLYMLTLFIFLCSLVFILSRFRVFVGLQRLQHLEFLQTVPQNFPSNGLNGF